MAISSVYRLDFRNKCLDSLTPMNFPRHSHGICFIQNSIYVAGGFGNEENNSLLNQCERFDFRLGKWIVVADLNRKSSGCCLVPFSKRSIFKFGGRSENSENPDCNIIERYDLFKDVWEEIPFDLKNFYIESHSAGIQISNNEILLFGGYFTIFFKLVYLNIKFYFFN